LRFQGIVLGILLPAMACASPRTGGDPDTRPDTLAEVGSGVITAADLTERIDLMPFPGKDRPSESDSVKARALESLVAERLLAEEATVRGIGFDSVTALRLDALERAFVRDELYKKEVSAGVHASDAEIHSGLKKYLFQLRLVIFRCPSEESARALSVSLERAGSDTLGAPVSGPLPGVRPTSADTVIMNYGVTDESIEGPAYALDVPHRASPPILSPMLGWTVLYLVDRGLNPAASAQNLTERMITVKNTVERRKARAKGIRYMASVLDPRKAEADRGTLELLGKTLHALIASDTAAHRSGDRFIVTPGEVDNLEETLRGDLSRVLVTVQGGALTLGQALQSFRLEPFTTPSLGRRTFAYILNESVKRIAREEILAREGYGMNLQSSPAVTHDVSTWRNNWLAHMMEAGFKRSAGEPTEEEETRELIGYAHLLSPGYEVNVREIFTDSLRKAERYAEILRNGADMAALARSVSTRKGWAERGGESEYFHVRSFPELGVRALLADSGALVGPVSLTGGYSLFRVLGKRLPAGDSAVTVDSLRRALQDDIRSEIRRKNLDRFIAGLAEKFGVHMYAERLKGVSLFSHNMFTRRLIGFGGMMNAAPLLEPQWGWVSEYVRAHDQAP